MLSLYFNFPPILGAGEWPAGPPGARVVRSQRSSSGRGRRFVRARVIFLSRSHATCMRLMMTAHCRLLTSMPVPLAGFLKFERWQVLGDGLHVCLYYLIITHVAVADVAVAHVTECRKGSTGPHVGNVAESNNLGDGKERAETSRMVL